MNMIDWRIVCWSLRFAACYVTAALISPIAAVAGAPVWLAIVGGGAVGVLLLAVVIREESEL